MPILTVTPTQKTLLETMSNELDKALGYGVNDGSTKFVNEMFNYLAAKFGPDAKIQTKGFLLSAAAAMFSAGILFPSGGGAVPPTWTAVSYDNSYVDFGAPYSGTAYFKDPLGIVHVRIAAKDGTTSTSIFTLPTGFRPGGQKLFIGYADGIVSVFTVTAGGAISANGGTTNAIIDFSFFAEA